MRTIEEQKTFINNIFHIMKFKDQKPDPDKRRICIAINKARYGNPSSIIIEFTGTPAWLQIFFQLNTDGYGNTILVNGVPVKGNQRRYESLFRIVSDFVKPYVSNEDT